MVRVAEKPDEFQGRLAEGRDWRSIVQMVSDLPPLPNVAAQASRLLEDPDTTPEQVTELVGKDPALAARVLKIANSAMFARQGKIGTLNKAVVLIGFKTLKGLVLSAAMRGVVSGNSVLDRVIWQNSICTAFFSGEIARAIKAPFHEEAFVHGLLHDMGKIVLIHRMKAEYVKVINTVCRGYTFTDAEQMHLGYTHALVGALVAKKWNFSANMCQVILHHHDPLEPPYSDLDLTKAAIVQAADHMAYVLGVGCPDGHPDCLEMTRQCLSNLGIGDVDAFIEKSRDVWIDQASILGDNVNGTDT